MNRQELRVELAWFCGCGDPPLAADALLRFLDMHPLYEGWGEWAEAMPDAGLRWLFLYVLDDRTDWFEHGSAVSGQWLEPKGEAVRDALRREKVLDGFESLFAEHCVHGFDFDDESHDCATFAKSEGEIKEAEHG